MDKIQIYDQSINKLVESFEEISKETLNVSWDVVSKNSKILNKIPIVNFALSLIKTGLNIRDVYFVKKIAKFFYNLNDGSITKQERELFLKKHFENKNDKERTCEIILHSIDHTNEMNKINILSNITNSLIKGKIDLDEFIRFVNIYNSINPDDIAIIKILFDVEDKEYTKIKNIKFGNQYSNSLKLGISRKLETLCIVTIDNNTCESLSNIMEGKVRLTILGEKFCEVGFMPTNY